jgi:O-antigen/teichoic acid export membrane protein
MQLHNLKQRLHPFAMLFKNAAWLISGEVLAKLSRIITIVVLAGALTPMSYGTAMLALAVHDVLRLLLRSGAGAQIIQCAPEDLVAYAKNGATIQWLICLSLALLQYLLADPIARFYDNPQLADLLKMMAACYVFYPWVSVRVFLLQRENRMGWYSLRNGACIVAENLSIAIFALMGADIMAVALGKLVFSLLWLLLFSFSPVKGYGLGFDAATFGKLARTSGQLFSSEFLRALRMHADTFIAGKLMAPELFGIYTFAKSAGIGLSQSICNAFNGALFPFMCRLQRQGTLFEQQTLIYRITVAIGCVFVLQALLAPIYIPLIFDQKWHATIPVVSMLCLIALPTLIVDTYCSFQRANGAYLTETLTRLSCLFISLSMLVLFAPEQPMEFAMVLLLSGFTWCLAILPGYSLVQKSYALMTLLVNRRKSHEC